jgi:guanine deaminase
MGFNIHILSGRNRSTNLAGHAALAASFNRARMLKGCEIYINGAPCPMCMSAIYWSRIDHVYFAASLKDTSAIGFDDAFQYEDFAKPWSQRRIPVTENFERETGLKAYKAWMDKKDRHPY